MAFTKWLKVQNNVGARLYTVRYNYKKATPSIFRHIDIRAKKDIANLEGALSRIMRIQGVPYVMKDDPLGRLNSVYLSYWNDGSIFLVSNKIVSLYTKFINCI